MATGSNLVIFGNFHSFGKFTTGADISSKNGHISKKKQTQEKTFYHFVVLKTTTHWQKDTLVAVRGREIWMPEWEKNRFLISIVLVSRWPCLRGYKSKNKKLQQSSDALNELSPLS
jgi:hypothetical protein